MTTALSSATPATLRRALDEFLETDRRTAAEVHYALAVLAARAGDVSEAKEHAQLSIALFDETQVGSLADAAARNTAVAGVVLPDLIHGEVVRDRLALLGVTL